MKQQSRGNQPSLLLIYTGGTIGMVEDVQSKSLKPFDFGQITDYIPELKKLNVSLTTIAFEHPIDSSDINPSIWIRLVDLIVKNYNGYDGFVILHGSDTMAYTASMLSYMLENLQKPVILTGSQLPMGIIRTDGKENIITAIEIAASKEKNKTIVPEVCIYFEYRLYRGNRTHKFNAEQFQAFKSSNYPVLAEAGVHITYNRNYIQPSTNKRLNPHLCLDTNVGVLKLFPGVTPAYVSALLTTPGLKGLVLETFGSGNAPSQEWFLTLLGNAIRSGLIVLNVTQCNAGAVEQGKYETSIGLKKAGVISGADITFEAAITKLMFLLGQPLSAKEIKQQLSQSLRGEMTLPN